MSDEEVMTEKALVHDGTPWPWLIGTAFPFLAFVFLLAGHSAVDHAEPRIGQAIMQYLLAAAVGTTAIVLTIQRYGDHMQSIGIVGGIGGLSIGAFTAYALEESYADGGFGVAILFIYFVLPTFLIGFAITLAIMATRQGWEGTARTFLMWGMVGCVAALVAAMYHLFTINMQADLAREAHEASAVSWLVAASVLGGSAWLSRRARC